MSRGAIDIGSHTATHPDLTRIPPDVAEEEIRTSRQIIEDRLGREVSAFAYPFGRSNSSVRVLVAREYDCACSTRLGVVGASSALDQLQRIEMHYFSSRKRFTALLRGRASSYLAVRRFLRLVRSVADPILSSA
jgi:peptidoglycan/xylan/chitin deacetylase (PgdA/CDA1 family)